jgi:hypothetical protein
MVKRQIGKKCYEVTIVVNTPLTFSTNFAKKIGIMKQFIVP